MYAQEAVVFLAVSALAGVITYVWRSMRDALLLQQLGSNAARGISRPTPARAACNDYARNNAAVRIKVCGVNGGAEWYLVAPPPL